MPNHITTLMTVIGSEADVAAFEATHIRPEPDPKGKEESDELCFDLETVIPMPSCIKDTIRDCFNGNKDEQCGDADVDYYAKACLVDAKRAPILPHQRSSHFPEDVHSWEDLKRWYETTNPEAVKYGKRALLAAAETGYPGWYEWSTANWGTKWNSYRYERRDRADGSFMFAFETAWAPPRPVFDKLAEMYPALVFYVEAIDEGGPAYTGRWAEGKGAISRVDANRNMHISVYGSAEHWDEIHNEEDDEAE